MAKKSPSRFPSDDFLSRSRRRIVAIVNPISGPRDMTPAVEAIGSLLAREGARLEILHTTGPGSAAFLAGSRTGDADAILVVGGDGTVGEVINGLGEGSAPLLILPTGTENLLARELEFPMDPARVARTLLQGEAFSADLGVMNGRRFASILGVGFDAECVQRLCEARRGHIGYRSYLGPVWRTFLGHRFPTLCVEADGAPLFEGQGLAFVGVISRYAMGLRVLKRARNDDGMLDVAAFPCGSRRSLVGHVTRLLLGMPHARDARSAQCRGVRISSPSGANVAVQLDGDFAGCLPVEVGVLAGAVRFLRPIPEG